MMQTVIDAITKVLSLFLIFLMAVIVLDVTWQVFTRFILKDPSSFTEELAGFLLIWIGLLGASLCILYPGTSRNRHPDHAFKSGEKKVGWHAHRNDRISICTFCSGDRWPASCKSYLYTPSDIGSDRDSDGICLSRPAADRSVDDDICGIFYFCALETAGPSS